MRSLLDQIWEVSHTQSLTLCLCPQLKVSTTKKTENCDVFTFLQFLFLSMCWILWWRSLLLLQHRHCHIELMGLFSLDLCKCVVDLGGTLDNPLIHHRKWLCRGRNMLLESHHLLLKFHKTRFHLFKLVLICNRGSRNRCCSFRG